MANLKKAKILQFPPQQNCHEPSFSVEADFSLQLSNVVELFPGCKEKQSFTEILNTAALESESKAMTVRRNRALQHVKNRLRLTSRQLCALEEIEAINDRLCAGVFDVVEAEAAYHQKTLLVLEKAVPLPYLKIDNATWAIHCMNVTVCTLLSPSVQCIGTPFKMTDERLREFQKLKSGIYQELEQAEHELALLCIRKNLSWKKRALAVWDGLKSRIQRFSMQTN